MEYAKFRQLIAGRETTNVDFKIRCDAFLGRTGPNAEVAKDICAMANNGNVASYIIVGVADDGRHFASVTNPHLTDDNFQDFCKTAIDPPPRIRLHSECWDHALPAHRGKRFLIIQVGPQARQAHRLARDFISYEERVFHRRNEVWIRRGATSDLATPEEIARLAKGEAPDDVPKPESNIEYERLPRDEQKDALWSDLVGYVEELGGLVDHGRLALRLGKVRYVWGCAIEAECSSKLSAWNAIRQAWMYEHGVLLAVMGAAAKRPPHPRVDLSFSDRWGAFSLLNPRWLRAGYGGSQDHWLPANTSGLVVTALTLSRIRDTHTLRRAVGEMLLSLEGDPDLLARMREARDGMNDNLRRWLKQGWLVPTNHWYSGGRPTRAELAEDEVFDTRLSRAVLRRERDPWCMHAAESVLALSAGRLPEAFDVD